MRLISLLTALAVTAAAAEPLPVRVEVFCDSTDKSCTYILDEVIAPLAQTYGDTFTYRYSNTEQPEAKKRFEKIQIAYEDRFNDLPAVFVNKRFISGRTNIKRKLKRQVKRTLGTGADWPDTAYTVTRTRTAPGPAHVLLFYSPDCGYCTEVKTNLLPVLKKKYGTQVFFHLVDVETSKGNGILRTLEKTYDEPGNYVPTAFAGGKFLSGKNEVTGRLDWWVEEVIKHGGCDVPDAAR